jgi:nicotinamidase-related amidase
VVGTETHVCVFQTVRDLVEAGNNVHVVRDAVCSRFDENYRSGLELMRDVGAVVTNTETVVFDVLKCAGTPEFKAISPLVK